MIQKYLDWVCFGVYLDVSSQELCHATKSKKQ